MTDAFETLGVAPRFGLDLALLEQRHRALSAALHPDRYVGRPAGERRQALGRAIEVNAAYRELRDPLRRAELLLARAPAHAEPPIDDDFLMEALEAREDLRELAKRRDISGIEAALASVEVAVRALEAELSTLLDEDAPSGASTTRAAALLGQLRYHRRYLDEARTHLDELS